MSASPSIPPHGPKLAEVLLRRVFARPPRELVDGELLQALQEAGGPVPVDPVREPRKGQRVDVRV